MNNLEKSEKSKTMPCGYIEKPKEELEKEGWVEDFSFHSNIAEQWNMACDRARDIKNSGDWEVKLKLDDQEGRRKDSVTYIYKRKTPQRIKWDNEQGY